MSGLLLEVNTWDCWISYKNGYAGLLIIHLLPLLKPWLISQVTFFGKWSSELLQLVPLPYSRGRSARYSDKLHDFSVTIPRCYTDVYVNNLFSCIAKFWNSLLIECFPFTYDLSGFNSGINKHLLTVGSF